MAKIVRFPVPLSPGRRRRLASQEGISTTSFEASIRAHNRELVCLGLAAATDQDIAFVMACRDGRIRPDDIAGDDRRARLARRIVNALNTQGIAEREQSEAL